jgi:Lar family restriction alleviation protein
MSEKLKPCPFCGKEVAVFTTCKEEEDCAKFEVCEDVGYLCIVCDFNKGGCGASGGYHETREEAIDAWNRRAEK